MLSSLVAPPLVAPPLVAPPLITPPLPIFVGITDLMVISPRSVKLPTPGWQGDAFSLPVGASGLTLIYLQDLVSSKRFLVDSDASVSVFPSPPSASGFGVRFVTADGSLFASRIIPLWFGFHRFDWPFQLAPVSLPILGVESRRQL